MYCDHQRGLEAEQAVRSYFQRQNWVLIASRYKTPFAELDLIVKKNQTLKVLEVKTLDNDHFLSFRLGKNQKERIKRACHFLQSQWKIDVELELVFVNKHKELTFYVIEFDS